MGRGERGGGGRGEGRKRDCGGNKRLPSSEGSGSEHGYVLP